MFRVAVAVQQQDGDGLDAYGHEPVAHRVHARLVQRDVRLAFGGHALAHLETQRAFDQRQVLAEIQVVGVRPVDAPDLVDVAKALGDEQRGLRAGALDHGVDGDGRSVQEQRGVAKARTGLGYALRDALDEAPGSRQRLAEQQPAAALVERSDVGEGAADVGGEACTHLQLISP